MEKGWVCLLRSGWTFGKYLRSKTSLAKRSGGSRISGHPHLKTATSISQMELYSVCAMATDVSVRLHGALDASYCIRRGLTSACAQPRDHLSSAYALKHIRDLSCYSPNNALIMITTEVLSVSNVPRSASTGGFLLSKRYTRHVPQPSRSM